MSSRRTVPNRGQKDSYYIKDAHPAIIDRETWDKACALRASRRVLYKVQIGRPKNVTKPETSFGICPYCGKNYFIKRLANAKTGIKYTLTCGSNRSTLTCRDSESVFIDDLKEIILEQIKILKENPLSLKKELKSAFYFDKAPLELKINTLNEQINTLRMRINEIANKNDESYMLLKDEMGLKIENLVTERKQAENALLTQSNYDHLVKDILESLNSLSTTDKEQNYRTLFQRMVVKSRTDLTFIIGNPDISKLDLMSLHKTMEGKYVIQVRAQMYEVSFGVFFNK